MMGTRTASGDIVVRLIKKVQEQFGELLEAIIMPGEWEEAVLQQQVADACTEGLKLILTDRLPVGKALFVLKGGKV